MVEARLDEMERTINRLNADLGAVVNDVNTKSSEFWDKIQLEFANQSTNMGVVVSDARNEFATIRVHIENMKKTEDSTAAEVILKIW